MKLHPIKATNLRLPEIGQFIIRYFSDVASLGIKLNQDSDLYTVHMLLQSQSDAYDAAMKQIKAMAETKELETLDAHRDKKVAVLRRAVSVFEYSEIEEEQQAYHKARIIMKNYTGLEKENYEAETFNIQKLLQEWDKPEHRQVAGRLGLKTHLENLKESANRFDTLFSNRSSTVVEKVAYDTLALKKQLLETYNRLVYYVAGNAAVKTDNAAFYEKILEAINNGRKYFSDLMAKRNGGSDTDREQATPE